MNTSAGILIVEDESIVALDLEMRLERIGYRVVGKAATGKEALELARERRPSLVFMDIRLKGEQDGVETARVLKRELDVPVVFLTAYADPATVDRAKATEPFGFLIKPFEERELRATVEVALHKHRVEARLKKMERWLATTLESIGDAVIATDRSAIVTFMNDAAERLTGWRRENALGKSFSDVFPITIDAPRLEEGEPPTFALDGVISNGIRVDARADTWLLTLDGQRVPVEVTVAPIRDERDVIAGMVAASRDVSERKHHEEMLERLAMTDSLTGLYNRRAFEQRLTEEFARTLRFGSQLCLAILDVDEFKRINDLRGHDVGDQVLASVGDTMRACLRSMDVCGRIGGDEFALVLVESTIEQAHDVLDRICKEVAKRTVSTPDGLTIHATLSAGVARCTPDVRSVAALMKLADTAMYAAKTRGRNRVVVAPRPHATREALS